ncbi:helix-turn-helix transcriptional regulator [Pseudonocardia abyssalis]|uniref:AAA family ATPase n=1 Tax=Pseudonocardia abyssalis TaxID=2792008 RepID=A0ABS6UMS9_9PSEU|nr:LuxR family transcriptional regulator [Pseudonocardia abyssalis]MBW0115636.1 AAA family ATPase [Pseudonocardia abyssalis]MBW0133550.1 AAA family ATPase [Pseudonocardia abyssalis]
MSETVAVGRDAQLAEVERFLDRAADGPAGLLLEGPAGIGKTTVWRAAITAARARGHRVLSATAVDAESDLPFVGLRDLSAVVPVEAGDGLPAVQRAALDVALLRSGDPGAAADPSAVCAAALGVVRLLAAEGPLVVAVDDVTWMDRSSQRLLRYVLRRLRRERVGVLLARRTGEPGVPIGLDAPALAATTVRVELGALDVDDVHVLLTEHAGMALSARTTGHIHRVSGGNPFYAVEIGRAVVAGGRRRPSEEDLPVPGGVLAVTTRRLAALSAAARRTLGVVALLSATTVDRVTAVVGPETAAALEEAVDEGLLDVDGADVRFTHPILRSAVTAGLPALRRQGLHRELAAATDDPAERAVHLAAAATGPDPAVAAALDAAARRASAQGAPDAAAALADRAVALTPPDRPDDRARRVIDAACHHYRADDADTARERLRPLVADLPPGPLRAEALLWSGTFWSEDDTDEALTQLRGALGVVAELAGTDDGGGVLGELAAAAHRQLAVVQVFAGNTFSADAHAHQGLRIALTGSDADSIAESRATLAWTQFWDGHGLRPELLEPASAQRRWTRFAPNDKTPGLVSGMLLSLTDDLDAARATLRAEYGDARDRGLDRAACIALFNLIEVERRAGHWALALDLADEGHRVADASGDGLGRSLLLQARGHVRARLGMLAEARADAADAMALGTAVSSPMAVRFGHTLLGFVELSCGDHAAVDRHLSPLAERLLHGGFDPGLSRFVLDHVEALVALGELDRADVLLARFTAQAQALGRASSLAGATRCRALLLAARGDADGAAAASTEAIAAHERLGAPFEHGRTLLVAGSIHRRAKRRRAARDALRAAVVIFEELGSPPWTARAREELARIGGRAPSATALTGAEERVAALVAAGRSNREVAAELFLTVATVEATLWKVYRKLGVRSRTELSVVRARTVRRSPGR